MPARLVSDILPFVNTYEPALRALGDPTRRRILEILRDGPLPVGVLASHLPVSRPAVSQHLKALELAGLVRVRQEGTRRHYELEPDGLAGLRRYLDSFWTQTLAAFQAEAERGSGDERKGDEIR